MPEPFQAESEPAHLVTCPQCGHQAQAPQAPATSVFRCDRCDQRIAFGTPVPRVVFSPTTDPRFLRLLVENGVPGQEARFHLAIDVFYARELAQHILKVTAAAPPAHDGNG